MPQPLIGGAHHLVVTGERLTLFRVQREVLERLESGPTEEPTVVLTHRHCVELDNLCLETYAGTTVECVSIVAF